MHLSFRHLFGFLLYLGAFGPLILGVLDSSFLFLPFGNDILVIVLVARDHNHLPIYILTASLGSTAGVLLLDLVCRNSGEKGLERMMSRKRLEYLKRKMGQRASVALTIACLAPPPFPFTAVVAAASAFQYPRLRLLAVVAMGRAIRFLVVGMLAIWLGRQILVIVRSTGFTRFMIGFVLVCLAGSIFSVIRWVRKPLA